MVTPRTNRLLKIAKKEAAALGHPYITSLHLLFGLLKIGGPRCRELIDSGHDLEEVSIKLQQLFVTEDSVEIGGVVVGISVKNVLDLAAKNASDSKKHWVGTEHVLFGLLAEKEGEVARLLRN
jgi:ATP-dependent Clp protease ATP-binding subunit ClpC